MFPKYIINNVCVIFLRAFLQNFKPSMKEEVNLPLYYEKYLEFFGDTFSTTWKKRISVKKIINKGVPSNWKTFCQIIFRNTRVRLNRKIRKYFGSLHIHHWNGSKKIPRENLLKQKLARKNIDRHVQNQSTIFLDYT